MAKLGEGNEAVHPLACQKMLARLLGLEEEYQKGQTGSEVAGELCTIYSDLVQYYDLKRDPIFTYFLEKIQVLSLVESSKNLRKKHKVEPNVGLTLENSMIEITRYWFDEST